jgi:hypothetical protein
MTGRFNGRTARTANPAQTTAFFEVWKGDSAEAVDAGYFSNGETVPPFRNLPDIGISGSTGENTSTTPAEVLWIGGDK